MKVQGGFPLEGINVVECGSWIQAPRAASFLGEMGANVIKVEPTGQGDPARGLKSIRGLPTTLPGGGNWYWEYINRNKRSMTIDLKKDKGQEVLCRLLTRADVFIHNFRAKVVDELGIGYDRLRQNNPQLIYAVASGFGPKGPGSDRPAFDYIGQAQSGIMDAAAAPGVAPQWIVGGIADQFCAMVLCWAIAVALFVRERSGLGQELDASQLGSLIHLQGLNLAAVCYTGRETPKLAREATSNPLWNHYRCYDGKWICLAHMQFERYWPRFCEVIDRPDLKPALSEVEAERGSTARKIVSTLDDVFATKTSTEWLELLQQEFICCSINAVSDLVNDPQVLANGYVVELDYPGSGRIKVPGFPFNLMKSPLAPHRPAPEFGQHTEEILQELGYNWTDIESLKTAGVV